MRGRLFARFSSKNFPHLIKEIIKGCANYAEGGTPGGWVKRNLKAKQTSGSTQKCHFRWANKKKNYVLTEELKKVQTNQVELCVDYIFHIKVICTNP